MECELLRSPMISYRSLLYNTTVLYDKPWLLGVYNKYTTLILSHRMFTIDKPLGQNTPK